MTRVINAIWWLVGQTTLKCASFDAIFGIVGGRSMRMTIALDDALMARAEELTGIRERPALLREALTALVQREAARRLARLGGSDPEAVAAPRRRPD